MSKFLRILIVVTAVFTIQAKTLPKSDLVSLNFSENTPISILLRFYSYLTEKPVWISSEVDTNRGVPKISKETIPVSDAIDILHERISISGQVKIYEKDGAIYVEPVQTTEN